MRVPKAYPAYFGSYGEIDKIRAFLDEESGSQDKTNLWAVDTDDEYHEEAQSKTRH